MLKRTDITLHFNDKMNVIKKFYDGGWWWYEAIVVSTQAQTFCILDRD